jgi:hypothetical protein
MQIEKRRLTFEQWKIYENFQQSTVNQIGIKESNDDVIYRLKHP